MFISFYNQFQTFLVEKLPCIESIDRKGELYNFGRHYETLISAEQALFRCFLVVKDLCGAFMRVG